MKWRKLLCAAGLALAFAPAQTAPGRAQSNGAPNYFPREVLAVTEAATEADRLAAAAAPLGYQVLERAPLEAFDLVLLKFQYPEERNGPGAIAELESLGVEATIGVNHLYKPAETDAAHRSSRDYAAALIEWPETGCAGAPIGVIDTDIGALAPPGVIVESFLSTGDRPSPADHGIGVLSLLQGAESRSGLTPEAPIYVAAVAEEDEEGAAFIRVERVAMALDWLAQQGVRVVNLSISGPHNRVLRRVAGAASARGLILVAAAGNEGPEAGPAFPAAFPDVISVTAVDARLRVYRDANQGEYVDFAAPGVDVWVANAEGGARYASGTSYAAPFVAAAISAYLAEAPESVADAAAARKLLAANALDLGEPGRDPVFGVGLTRAPQSCR